MTEKNLAEHAISARSRVNLLEAMRGEAFAFAKYKLFAKNARANGDNELADLFDKTADQEYMEHFTEQANLLQLAGTDEQDVTDAIAGESFEVDALYKRSPKKPAKTAMSRWHTALKKYATMKSFINWPSRRRSSRYKRAKGP